MNNRGFGAILAVIALFGGAAGCGAESVDPCAEVGTKTCEKSCACSSKCEFTAGGLGLGFKSEESCEQFFALSCSDPKSKTVDFPACLKALDAAKCDDKGTLVFPMECNGE